MRIDLLHRGADHTPYIVSASGPDGYGDIIMGPSDRILERGDIMIIDTGTLYDGYFCDFDRNYAFGEASDKARRAYDTVFPQHRSRTRRGATRRYHDRCLAGDVVYTRSGRRHGQ